MVATLGSAVDSNTPTTSGGDVVSWTSDPGLPGGLTLSPAGVVSGTPITITATATYIITATNSGGSDTIDLVFTVNDGKVVDHFS